MNNSPIGVFDSGVGGTSIWKEIHTALPYENTIYLADSKNAPYGEKDPKKILELSIKNTELLLQKGCKLVVVACNTATTNAIGFLRENYDLPFVGIEPAIKPAALGSKSKAIGVLATKGTLTSSLFHATTQAYTDGITVIEKEGTGLVPLIEAGNVYASATKTLLKQYLEPMLDKNIDHLVLGCSHYPYLIPVLKELLPSGVNIIDSGEAVARQTKAVLEQCQLFNALTEPSFHSFYSNANPDVLTQFVGFSTAKKTIQYLDF